MRSSIWDMVSINAMARSGRCTQTSFLAFAHFSAAFLVLNVFDSLYPCPSRRNLTFACQRFSPDLHTRGMIVAILYTPCSMHDLSHAIWDKTRDNYAGKIAQNGQK